MGTGSMVPTKERNHAGVFVSCGNQGILLDCGEGVQRQLRHAGISLTKLSIILISHWHGDHVLGLPGLVQSLASMDPTKSLKIYGPKGTKKRFGMLKKAFVFEENSEVQVFDVAKRKFHDSETISIEALPLDHTTTCLGYSIVQKGKRKINLEAIKKAGIPQGPLIGQLQDGYPIKWQGKRIDPDQVSYVEHGKKIAYVTDTAVCNNAVELAKDSDMLIIESTYADDLEDKAEKNKHLTARQAAMIANSANAKKLVLTHFSQRYKTISQIEEDARTVFSGAICAFDLMKTRI